MLTALLPALGVDLLVVGVLPAASVARRRS